MLEAIDDSFFFFFLFVSEKFRKTVILLYIKRYEIAASLFAKTKEGEVKGGGGVVKIKKRKKIKLNCLPEVQRGRTLTFVQKSRQVSSKERAKGDRNLIFHL